MFSNDHRVLSQGNTRLGLLYLFNNSQRYTYDWLSSSVPLTLFCKAKLYFKQVFSQEIESAVQRHTFGKKRILWFAHLFLDFSVHTPETDWACLQIMMRMSQDTCSLVK